ncbi:MAG: mono/diheme cytochrome c family protein [Rhodothermales bacterium]|jgi:mono/diheme cytochrome c family protein
MTGSLPPTFSMIPMRALMAVVVMVVLTGCRGDSSDAPPIHINPNMDHQERFDPQERNDFFADGRAMRAPVAGTVARGFLREDTAFHFGRDASGAFVATNPVEMTAQFLARGQERYEIFCAVCHGDAGDGKGIIMTGNYGYVPAPTYHSDALRAAPDGYFFDALSNGIRSMPGYAQQIPIADRWAITAYIRALQRSQYAQGTGMASSSQPSAGASSAK